MADSRTPLIYDDPSLACVIHLVNFATPWVHQPTPAEFGGDFFALEVPVLSWVIQDTEERWRERFGIYLSNLLGEDHRTLIKNLPSNFISVTIANIFYNSRIMVDAVLPSRLNHMFNGSVYSAANYWVAYHLIGMLLGDITNNDMNDGLHRKKELLDLQKVLAISIQPILADHPVIKRETHVIVSVSRSDSERPVIYADADNFEKYLDNGGTPEALAMNFYKQGTNPVV